MRHQSNHVKLRAYAKINLSLKVLGRRPDGYHDIDSVMQSISLHDEIQIKRTDSNIFVTCTSDIIDNIVLKAAELILKQAKVTSGLEIDIKKNIPIAAGLAGGSTDAAATILGINELLELNLHMDQMLEIGSKIGSDVPFCMVGGTSRCTGRGEKLERIEPKGDSAYILVVPHIVADQKTKLIYEEFSKAEPSMTENDLDAAAEKVFPQIKETKDKLIKLTGRNWKMSGAGPTLFMEMNTLSDTEKFLPILNDLKMPFFVATSMKSGIKFDH